ncbi:MAG: pyruvate dehydrogenase (acetyl-transferring) E1 component subunit alpha [Candidatus Bathyarchaeia archaeon]
MIRPDGTYDAELEPKILQKDLVKLYRLMLLVRNFDGRAMNLQRLGKIPLYGQCIGQEACHIGSIFALTLDDWVVPYFREVGVSLFRGTSLKVVLNQLFGNSEDVCKGRNMPCMWTDKNLRIFTPEAPVGAKIPVAVGISLAAKLRNEKNIVLVYFGDGATSSDGFHAGLNFAGVFNTPTVFLCENNQYAISVPVRNQTASESLAVKATAYGFEGVQVDGNDLLAVYRATADAVTKARAGKGPTLIEAVTYRMGAHSTSDDPKRYRSDEEVENWRQKDPIKRFRAYLERKGYWNEENENRALEEVDQEVREAIKEVEKLPPPKIETLFDDVYSERPWHLREQQEEMSKD